MSILTFIVALIMGLGFLYIGASVFAKSCLLLVNLLHKHMGDDWIRSNALPITKQIASRCIQLAKYTIARVRRRQSISTIDLAMLDVPTYLRKSKKRKSEKIVCF